MKKPTRFVEALPTGTVLKVVAVSRGRMTKGHRQTTFYKTSAGIIYWSGHGRLDLQGAYGASGEQRAAFCRLAGESLKDLNAAARKLRIAENKADKVRRLERIKEMARAAGYKLVKLP